MESWGSVIASVMLKRPAASDTSNLVDVGTIDKLVYILINGPPAGYKGNKRLLKLALCNKYGTSFHKNFKPASKSKLMSEVVTTKVISRIQNELNDTTLPCFL